MKKKLFTLLALIVGAVGSAWGDTETATIDFEDGTVSDVFYETNSSGVTTSIEELNTYEWSDGKKYSGAPTGSDKAFVTSLGGTKGTSTILVTKTSYDAISEISFYIATTDRGKTELGLFVSSKQDFSSDVTEVMAKTTLSSTDFGNTSNGTFKLMTFTLSSAVSGYVKIILAQGSNSNNKIMALDDVVIKYDPSAADNRNFLSLSFTPNDKTIGVGNTLTTSLSWTEDTSGESAKYTVSYNSNDEAIATVNSSGVVTGVAEGVATITATVTATANATYKTTAATITVNVVGSLILASEIVVPDETLDLSDEITSSAMLNGTWQHDSPFFGNDGTDNYIVFSNYSAYQSYATQTWIDMPNNGDKIGGSSAETSWDNTGIFKGSAGYTAQRAATSRVGDRPYTYYSFRIKGVTKVQALVKSASTSLNVVLAAFEISSNTPANSTMLYTKDKSNSVTTKSLELDKTKTYLVALYGEGTSNSQLYEMALFYDSSIQLYKSIAITCEGGYASYSCDRALDFSNSGAEAYIIKSTTENSAALTKVTKVPANTGIIVKGTKGETVNVAIATGTTDDVTGNLLKGTVNTPTAVEANTAYGLSKADGLFHLMNAGTIPANKAYLLASEVFQGGTAPVLSLEFSNGDATAIDDVRSKMEDVRGDFYNLNGQRVAQPTKGLYIVNGKKVIMK